MLPSQQALKNFYMSVQFQDPTKAVLMSEDIQIVALWALGADKSGGQEAADRLRETTRSMPVVFSKVLDGVLSDLGYS